MKNSIISLMLFLLCVNSYAQHNFKLKTPSNFESNNAITDINEILSLKNDLNEARRNNDYAFLNKYYSLQWRLYDFHKNLQMLDSAIYYAKIIGDKDLVGLGYMKLGRYYYVENYTDKALDNYLIADEYLKDTEDHYLKSIMLYHFAAIKLYLGDTQESINLFQKSIDYFKKQPDYKSQIHYLNCMFGLNVSYHQSGDMTNMERVNKEILEGGVRLMSDFHIHYGYISQGFIEHSKKKYRSSIDYTEKGLAYVLKDNDYEWIGFSYLNLGNSYWGLGQKDRGLVYYKKVDSIFNSNKVQSKLFRPMYEDLIKYYKSEKNIEKELYYINQLLKLDSVNHQLYAYLSPKINKEYHTKNLLFEKERLEKELNASNFQFKVFLQILPIFIIGFLFWIGYLNWNNRKLKRKYLELMEKTESKSLDKRPIDINDQILLELLFKLSIFEKNKDFLQSNLTLSKLATQLGSNSSYLSKTINEAKKKSFTAYLNELRITYIIDLLKNETKFRSYTIDAIAELAGFNTRQSFSKAFYEQTDIRPSYFLKEIQKEN